MKYSVQVPVNVNVEFHIKDKNKEIRIIPKVKNKEYVHKTGSEGAFIITKPSMMKKLKRYLKKAFK